MQIKECCNPLKRKDDRKHDEGLRKLRDDDSLWFFCRRWMTDVPKRSYICKLCGLDLLVQYTAFQLEIRNPDDLEADDLRENLERTQIYIDAILECQRKDTAEEEERRLWEESALENPPR